VRFRFIFIFLFIKSKPYRAELRSRLEVVLCSNCAGIAAAFLGTWCETRDVFIRSIWSDSHDWLARHFCFSNYSAAHEPRSADGSPIRPWTFRARCEKSMPGLCSCIIHSENLRTVVLSLGGNGLSGSRHMSRCSAREFGRSGELKRISARDLPSLRNLSARKEM